jgi:hypothetical protein
VLVSLSCCTLQELPELWALMVLLPVIGKKLSYACSADLVPLMEVSGIKQVCCLMVGFGALIKKSAA